MKKQYRVLYSFDKMADAENYLNDKKDIGKVDLFIEEEKTYYYSVSPYNEILKADNEGNSSPGNSPEKGLQFPADPSLDGTIHKNRLVMNDNGVAKLANTNDGSPGQKGKYQIVTDTLPVYPVGAEYEFDFKGVNFVDGDKIHFPILEDNFNNIYDREFTAKTTPNLSFDFQIGVSLSDSLDNIISLIRTSPSGAWSVSKSGDKIIFKNTGILTGIGGSNSYAMPTRYNNRDSMFVRNDIEPFNSALTYQLTGGYTAINFIDEYGQGAIFNLGAVNPDNYYPFQTVSNYFVNTIGDLYYYNGTTYEAVTAYSRLEAGTLVLVSNSNLQNEAGTFNAWSPTYQTNQGTNYTIKQIVQGVDGTLLQSWIDNLMSQGSDGTIVTLYNGDCQTHVIIHVLDMLDDFSSIGIPATGYNNWSIPQSALELSKVLKENFLQNPNSFFNVTSDGHSLGNPQAWIEIEEKVEQTYGNCNQQLLTFNENSNGANPFSTFFIYTQITAPKIVQPPVLVKPILGFLQKVINGVAYISDENINIGVVEDIDNNEITQEQIDEIINDFESIYNCYYVLGTDGQLRKIGLLIHEFTGLMFNYYVSLGGGLFLGIHTANRGQNLIVRRVIFVK